MGKAARRRKSRRRNYLAGLSYKDEDYFMSRLEMCVQSWVSEISVLARKWAICEYGYQRRIFTVLEEAAEILKECKVSKKYASEVLDMIRHECCSQVSRVVDPRLYRLSNMDQLVYKAKKTVRS